MFNHCDPKKRATCVNDPVKVMDYLGSPNLEFIYNSQRFDGTNYGDRIIVKESFV
jgi:hypothetical protein